MNEAITFTFVGDGVVSAIEQAKAVAGADVVQIRRRPAGDQSGLAAGLVDELADRRHAGMLGGGLRLFEDVEAELGKTRVQEVGARTSLEFRVVV